LKEKVLASITSNLETKIVVINPKTDLANLDLEKLISEGFPAKIVSVNEKSVKDQKDVAIIKIEENDLPTLAFADPEKEKLNIGQKLHTFGFPASANFSDKIDANFFEPTLSSGAVSSFKDSINADFKVAQIDIRASGGSSGSPILNEKGQVVGIMTFVSGVSSDKAGDGFSYAVPLSIIQDVLDKSSVYVAPGNLYDNFLKGLVSMSENHYLKAKEEFTLAKNFNQTFGQNIFIDDYVSKSDTAILEGKSIDSEWQLFLENIKPYQSLIVIIAVSIVVLFLLIIFLVFLLGKLRKDEKKIEELTHHDQQQDLISRQIPQPSPIVSTQSIPVPPPQASVPTVNVMPTQSQVSKMPPSASSRVNDIVAFIKKSVTAGQTDGLIFRGLKGGGYTEQEIQEAFMIFRHLK